MAAAVEEEWESAVGKLALVSKFVKVYRMFEHVPLLQERSRHRPPIFLHSVSLGSRVRL